MYQSNAPRLLKDVSEGLKKDLKSTAGVARVPACERVRYSSSICDLNTSTLRHLAYRAIHKKGAGAAVFVQNLHEDCDEKRVKKEEFDLQILLFL
jgi:hypothetical protein